MPSRPDDRLRYWDEQRRIQIRIGGTSPRALTALARRPHLPQILHIHVDQGFEQECWTGHLAVRAKDLVHAVRPGCPWKENYLTTRGLSKCRKVLIISGMDDFLAHVCSNIDETFCREIDRPDFTAVICPNLSAYEHCEHRVSLDNRAIVQQFMQSLAKRRLPAIFHTYIEDTDEFREWIVEYLRLNPTQSFVATGFERGAANNPAFVLRRLQILHEVEEEIGRPLHVVLTNIMTRLWAIRAAADLFPGRVHLSGASVFLRSVNGSLLTLAGRTLSWKECALECSRGRQLFAQNSRLLTSVIREQVPTFFAPPNGSAN